MVTIILYRNNSDNRTVNKSLVELATLEGTFRGPADVLKPTIIIKGTFQNQCNYVRIVELGRYYHAQVTIETNQLIRLDCMVDVLMSWKEQFKALPGIILRQEKSWNLYLTDPLIQTQQNDMIGIQSFPSGFSGEQYVLAVLGNNGT